MTPDTDLAALREGLGIRPTDSSSPLRRRRREQHEALDRMETELARLRKERDEYKLAAGAEADLFDTSQMQVRQERESRQKAERELARLEEGLRHTADELASRRGMIDRLVAADKFRALLADTEDGAA